MSKKPKFNKVLADKLMLRTKRWQEECLKLQAENDSLKTEIKAFRTREATYNQSQRRNRHLREAFATLQRLITEV